MAAIGFMLTGRVAMGSTQVDVSFT